MTLPHLFSLILLAVPLLVGCVSHQSGSLERASNMRVELIAGLQVKPNEQTIPIAAPEGLVASLFKRNLVADFGLIDRRGTVTEWAAADGVTLTLNEGILIGSSGLSEDLYSADIEPLRLAMSKGGGTYTRAFRYLDGERVIRRVDANCILRNSSDGVEFTEVCREPDGTFTNRFKVHSKTLQILASRQWVSREVGYLGLNPHDGS